MGFPNFDSYDKLYCSDLLISVKNHELSILKNREGETGTIKTFPELMYYLIKIIDKTVIRYSTGSRLFDDLIKKELINEITVAVNGVLERNNLVYKADYEREQK